MRITPDHDSRAASPPPHSRTVNSLRSHFALAPSTRDSSPVSCLLPDHPPCPSKLFFAPTNCSRPPSPPLLSFLFLSFPFLSFASIFSISFNPTTMTTRRTTTTARRPSCSHSRWLSAGCLAYGPRNFQTYC